MPKQSGPLLIATVLEPPSGRLESSVRRCSAECFSHIIYLYLSNVNSFIQFSWEQKPNTKLGPFWSPLLSLSLTLALSSLVGAALNTPCRSSSSALLQHQSPARRRPSGAEEGRCRPSGGPSVVFFSRSVDTCLAPDVLPSGLDTFQKTLISGMCLIEVLYILYQDWYYIDLICGKPVVQAGLGLGACSESQ